MTYDSDKYPLETGRRRFVKGVVGAGVLAGVGTASAAAIGVATNPVGRGGGVREYIGIELLDGPAPRGMPFVPVRVDDEGFLEGIWPDVGEETVAGRTVPVAEMELGGLTYSSEWFQYCGIQSSRALVPDADQDNALRYADDSTYDWQTEQVSPGDRINVADFEDFETWGNGIGAAGLGKPAMATWRSDGLDSSETLPVQVLRVAPAQFERMRASSPAVAEWLDAASDQFFVAWLNKCTHFCCVPAFKGSAQSAAFDGENRVYCPCHQSVYDPFSAVQESFVALPRPD